MICIAFHKDNELFLRRYQKDFIRLNNTKNSILVAVNPIHLQLPLPPDQDKLKNTKAAEQNNLLWTNRLKVFSKQIKEIILLEPKWNKELSFLELPVKITFTTTGTDTPQKKVFCCTESQPWLLQSLCLVKYLDKNKKIAESPVELPATSYFPKKIKVFRLADKIQISENVSAFRNSVWVKLT